MTQIDANALLAWVDHLAGEIGSLNADMAAAAAECRRRFAELQSEEQRLLRDGVRLVPRLLVLGRRAPAAATAFTARAEAQKAKRSAFVAWAQATLRSIEERRASLEAQLGRPIEDVADDGRALAILRKVLN